MKISAHFKHGDEAQRVRDAARKAGLTPSAFLRTVAMRAVGDERLLASLQEASATLHGEPRRTGTEG